MAHTYLTMPRQSSSNTEMFFAKVACAVAFSAKDLLKFHIPWIQWRDWRCPISEGSSGDKGIWQPNSVCCLRVRFGFPHLGVFFGWSKSDQGPVHYSFPKGWCK